MTAANRQFLNAIDLCLGARRSFQFTDADFHRLDVEKPIKIWMTIGELDDALKNIDSYGMFFAVSTRKLVKSKTSRKAD